MKLAEDKRKLALLALAVLAAVAFLMMPSVAELQRAVPEPIRRLYQPAPPVIPTPPYRRPDGPPRPTLPQRAFGSPSDTRSTASPTVRAYVPPVASPGPLTPALPTRGAMLGKFEGRTLIAKRGMCNVAIELYGDAGTAGQVVAYETLICYDPTAMYAVPNGKSTARDAVMALASRFLPVSFILSGAWEGGVLHLHVDKTVGRRDDCAMTSASMTPFGNRQITFEWEDATCGNADMILSQVGQ
jgi:hypothetical protein